MKNSALLKISFVVFVLILNQTILAQEGLDEELTIKMSNDICNCITSANPQNAEQTATLIDSCFALSFNHEQELNSKGYDLEDSNDVFLVSASVVMHLMGNCDILFKISQETMKDTEPVDSISKIESGQNCKEFFQGKFQNTDTDLDVITTMDGDIQTIYFSINDTYSKLKVNWLDDCRYTLTYIEGNDEVTRNWAEMYGETATVEIIEISGDDIVFVTRLKDTVFNSNMKKLHN